MIFKITLSVSGDNFWPNTVVYNISGNLAVKSFYCPNDNKFKTSSEVYGYGGMSFWHPKRFALDDSVLEYAAMFLEFIRVNHKLFSENGVEEWCLYIEVYYEGNQCNFEIFGQDFLEVLYKFNVSIPISVYCLPTKEYNQWVNEVELGWRSC